MTPYIEALRQSINNTSVVVDIGTGIGVFALVAAHSGARKVYAIEPNAAIQVARELAQANDYIQRIEFIEELSTVVSLPERADVIVSDLRGALPLAGKHLPTIVDARTRFLKPDGILIPRSDVLWVAIVEAPELYNRHFDDSETADLGLDLRATRRFTINTWRAGTVAANQLLTEPCKWAELNYHELTSPDVSNELVWTTFRDGTGHGFIVWFDTVLASNIGFSNAPGRGAKVYGSAFFPWSEPVSLTCGDRIAVVLNSTLVNDDYVWSWDTTVFDRDEREPARAQFKQSTFFAEPFTSRLLQQQSDVYVPSLDLEASIDRFVLNSVDGHQTQRAIASKLRAEFPEYFQSRRDALTRVAQVLGRY